ncbi:DUF2341 domain-containing protein, partial [Candidatus Parvarchaeota archaeon]|nr:DUF2341 domain-containing protein [Candidatus Parvarchaeota archaeon]
NSQDSLGVASSTTGVSNGLFFVGAWDFNIGSGSPVNFMVGDTNTGVLAPTSNSVYTANILSTTELTGQINYGKTYSYTSSTAESLSYLEFDFFSGSGGTITDTIYWTRANAYPPNGIMPTVTISNYTVIRSIFSFSTHPGNFTAKANTSLACNPQTKTVEAGSTYVFSNWNCTTTFNQSILPKASNWWVDYRGINKSNKTGDAIKINSNSSGSGIYVYSAGSNLSCSSNNVADAGAYNNLSNWLCVKEFVEQGLPTNTNWAVKYGNKINYSSSNLIKITNNFGNYSYSINNIPFPNRIYVPNSSSGYTISFGKLMINFSKHSIFTPQSIYKYTVLNITNSQISATPQPFQQMINLTINSSNGKYINQTGRYAFQNVEFFDTLNGSVIDSWLENYTSKYAIFWIKLPNGIPANATLTDIAIGFASNITDLFNNKTTGEAPQLSPTYAEYDDGANVFNFYSDFKGTKLNTTKWASGTSNGIITVDNGLTETIPYNAVTGSYTYISTSAYQITSPVVVESYANLSGFDTANFRMVPVALTQYNNQSWHADNSPNENGGGWVGNSFQVNGVDAETTSSSSYNGFVDSNYIPSNNNYNIFGVIYPDNGSFSVSYNSLSPYASTIDLVPTTPLYITISNWLNPSQTSFSTTYPINVEWLRIRAYPPNGVMPSVKLNALITKPINLFINGFSNNNITATYGKDSNFTVESYDHYVKLWETINSSVKSLTGFSKNISTDSGILAAGKIKVTGGSNSTDIGNISYYETINKANSYLNLTSIPKENYTSNGTNLIINASTFTINNQLSANLYINGVLNQTITSNALVNLGSYSGNYTIVLNSSGNKNYTADSITIKRTIYPSLASFLEYYIPINIKNMQHNATSQPFQQMVNFSYSAYKKYVNLSSGHDFQNLEFINMTNDKVIDSWLENYTSKYAIFWIKLPNGIPANATLTNIAIGFASNTTDLFNNKTTGEAPQLSPTYAEYDDGINVFNYYENFAGTSLPTGWTGSGYTVNNGVTVEPNYGISSNLKLQSSTDFIMDSFTDLYGSGTLYGNIGLAISTSSGSEAFGPGWNNGGIGFSRIGNNNNNGNGPYFNPEPSSGTYYVYSEYWVDSTSVPILYSYSNEITGGIDSAYLGTTLSPEISPDNNAYITTKWLRIRAYPPNGIMPTVEIPSLSLYLNGVVNANNSIINSSQSNFTAVASSNNYYVSIYVNGTEVAPLTKGKATYLKTLSAGLYKVTAHSNSSGILNVTYYERVLSSTVSFSDFQEYQELNISNTQSSATPSPFQQMVNVSSTDGSWTYINTSQTAAFGQNVEFFYANGTVIPSWLENYTSTNAIWWVKVGSIPANSKITIYMGLVNKTKNLFNAVNDGEAPQLSSTYTEYDDGANIFNNYWNFNGTSLPSGWVNANNGYGSVTVNNGITVASGALADISIPATSNIIEGYVDPTGATGTSKFDEVAVSWGIDGTSYNPYTYNSGFNWYSPGEPINTYNVYGMANNGSKAWWYFNFNQVQMVDTTISEPTLIGIGGGGSAGGTISAYWVLIRDFPPNGVMPSITFGSVS